MNRLSGLMLAVVLAVAAGCATVSHVPCAAAVAGRDGLTPVETVEISNVCWQFLAFLPVASGDVGNPDGWTCALFSRTTTVENQMKMLQAEAERIGAKKAVDVSTLATDEEFFLFLFVRDKIHTSAVLMK